VPETHWRGLQHSDVVEQVWPSPQQPVHVPQDPHEQVDWQVLVCVPQLPQLWLPVAPGEQSPSPTHEPHDPQLQLPSQTEVCVPHHPHDCVLTWPGVQDPLPVHVPQVFHVQEALHVLVCVPQLPHIWVADCPDWQAKSSSFTPSQSSSRPLHVSPPGSGTQFVSQDPFPSMSLQPARHLVVQPPDRQTGSALSPDGQTMPQVPQFVTSSSVRTQLPSQFVFVGGHSRTHSPSLHTSTASHALPQPPQFSWSESVSMHTPEQEVCPAGHEPSGRMSVSLPSGTAASESAWLASRAGASQSSEHPASMKRRPRQAHPRFDTKPILIIFYIFHR
jgi:hypothetical protein